MSETQTPRVLVIDSNVLFAKQLADAFRQEGFEVVHATQAAYALTMLERNTPAVILCSTALRELGALELPRILHADVQAAHIPIIALGDGGEHALMEAFRAGCDDYVDRRMGAESIVQHVRTFLRSQQEGFQPTQMLGSQDADLSGSLAHLDLPGVIQMLCQSRQMGAMYVNAGALDGVLFFEEGDISHAESGELVGDDAVVHILRRCYRAPSGVYKFVAGASAATRTVLRSATELMLEAFRSEDEERKGAAGGAR